MNVGLFGRGRWGKNIHRSLLELGNAVRVYDPALDGWTDDEVSMWADCLCVATPSHTHADVCEKLLEYGKPVFVEKPMATSLADAQRIENVTMVGHLMLHHPAFLEVQRRAENITSMCGVRFGGCPAPEGPYWSLSVHDVSMALVLAPDKPLELEATFNGPRVRRFKVYADSTYVIDRDDLFIDGERIELPRVEPLKVELAAFLSGEPQLSDGAFGLKVVEALEKRVTV
jgi:predicted dehydrogenase